MFQSASQAIGLPGSGVSQPSYLFKKDSRSDQEDQDADKDRELKRAGDEEEEEREVGYVPGGCPFTTVRFAIALYLVAYNLHWIPQTFLTDLLQVIIVWLRAPGV